MENQINPQFENINNALPSAEQIDFNPPQAWYDSPDIPDFTPGLDPEYVKLLEHYQPIIEQYTVPFTDDIKSVYPSENNDTNLSDDPYKNNFDRIFSAPIPKSDQVSIADPLVFSAKKTQFDRFYSHRNFSKLGFHPYANNEEYYNDNSTVFSDTVRMLTQFAKLTGSAIRGNYRSFGDMFGKDPYTMPDVQTSDEFEKAMGIGMSSRGGITGFSSNLFLNFGYTFGIILSVAAEELVLAGITAATGFGAAPAAAAKTGLNAGKVVRAAGQSIGNTFALGRMAKATRQLSQTLNKTDNARTFWQATKSGEWGVLGTLFLPETMAAVKKLQTAKTAGKSLSGIAKMSTMFGGFYREVRAINYAMSESKLESGFVLQQQIANGIAIEEQKKLQGLEPNLALVGENANKAAFATTMMNFGLIYMSNKLVLDTAFKGFNKTLTRNLNNSISGTAGRAIRQSNIVGPDGKLLRDIYSDAGKGVKGRINKLKAAGAKGIGYATINSSLRYFAANLAEGVQELGQEAISHGTKYYFSKLQENPLGGGADLYKASINEAINSQVSGQGLETFLSGFLMGGLAKGPQKLIFEVLPDLKNRIFDKEAYKEYQERREAEVKKIVEERNKNWNEFIDDPISYLDKHVNNFLIQNEVNSEMNEASYDGDMFKFIDAKDFAKFHHIYGLMESGSVDLFRTELQDFLNLTDEELNEAFPTFKEEIKQGKLRERANDLINLIDKAEKAYNENKDALVNPYDPNKYDKNTEEYKNELTKYASFEHIRYLQMFTQDSFNRALERADKIYNELASDPILKKIQANDLTVLLDENSIKSEINLLKIEIENLDDSEEGKKLKQEKQTKIEKLKKVSEVLNLKDNLKQDGSFDKRKVKRILEPLKEYIQFLADTRGDFVDVNRIKEVLKKITDHRALSERAKANNRALQYLAIPENFDRVLERQTAIYKSLFEKNKENVEARIKKYIGVIEKNNLLNGLADLDVYPDANEVEVFLITNDTRILRTFYHKDGTVTKDSGPVYKKIQNLIDVYNGISEEATQEEANQEEETDDAAKPPTRNKKVTQKEEGDDEILDYDFDIQLDKLSDTYHPVLKETLYRVYKESMNIASKAEQNTQTLSEWQKTDLALNIIDTYKFLKTKWKETLSKNKTDKSVIQDNFIKDIGLKDWLSFDTTKEDPDILNKNKENNTNILLYLDTPEVSYEEADVLKVLIKHKSDNYIVRILKTFVNGGSITNYKIITKTGLELSDQLLSDSTIFNKNGAIFSSLEDAKKAVEKLENKYHSNDLPVDFQYGGVTLFQGAYIFSGEEKFQVLSTPEKIKVTNTLEIVSEDGTIITINSPEEFKKNYSIDKLTPTIKSDKVSRIRINDPIRYIPYENEGEDRASAIQRLDYIFSNLTPEQRKGLELVVSDNPKSGTVTEIEFTFTDKEPNSQLSRVSDKYSIGIRISDPELRNQINEDLKKAGLNVSDSSEGIIAYLPNKNFIIYDNEGNVIDPRNIDLFTARNIFYKYNEEIDNADLEKIKENFAIQANLIGLIESKKSSSSLGIQIEREYEEGDYAKVLQLVLDTINQKEINTPEQLQLLTNYPKLYEKLLEIEYRRIKEILSRKGKTITLSELKSRAIAKRKTDADYIYFNNILKDFPQGSITQETNPELFNELVSKGLKPFQGLINRVLIGEKLNKIDEKLYSQATNEIKEEGLKVVTEDYRKEDDRKKFKEIDSKYDTEINNLLENSKKQQQGTIVITPEELENAGFYFNMTNRFKENERESISPKALYYNTIDGKNTVIYDNRKQFTINEKGERVFTRRDKTLSTIKFENGVNPASRHREIKDELGEKLYKTARNKGAYVLVVKNKGGEYTLVELKPRKLDRDEFVSFVDALIEQSEKTVNENLIEDTKKTAEKQDLRNSAYNVKFNDEQIDSKIYIISKPNTIISLELDPRGRIEIQFLKYDNKTKKYEKQLKNKYNQNSAERIGFNEIIEAQEKIKDGEDKYNVYFDMFQEHFNNVNKRLKELGINVNITVDDIRKNISNEATVEEILNNTETNHSKEVRKEYQITISQNDVDIQATKDIPLIVEAEKKKRDLIEKEKPEVKIDEKISEEEVEDLDELLGNSAEKIININNEIINILNEGAILTDIELAFYDNKRKIIEQFFYEKFEDVPGFSKEYVDKLSKEVDLISEQYGEEKEILKSYVQRIENIFDENATENQTNNINDIKNEFYNQIKLIENKYKTEELKKDEDIQETPTIKESGITVNEYLDKDTLSDRISELESIIRKKQEELFEKAISTGDRSILDNDEELNNLKRDLNVLMSQITGNKILKGVVLDEIDVENINVFLDWAAKNLPDYIDIKDLAVLGNNMKSGGVRVGAFALALSDIAGGMRVKGTLYTGAETPFRYHEAFHAVFRLLLTDEQQNKYLRLAAKEVRAKLRKEGISFEKALNDFKNLTSEYQDLSRSDLVKLYYEEYLADQFELFKQSPKSTKTDPANKSFFARLIEWIKAFFSRFTKNELRRLYENIDSGKFKSSTPVINRFTLAAEQGITVEANAIMIPYEVIDAKRNLYKTLDTDAANAMIRSIAATYLQREEAFRISKANYRDDDFEEKTRNEILDEVIKDYKELYDFTKPFNKELSFELKLILNDFYAAFVRFDDEIKKAVTTYLSLVDVKIDDSIYVYEEQEDDEGLRTVNDWDKDASNYGGWNSISSMLRKFIMTTTVEESDMFNHEELKEGERLIVPVDFAYAYNGILKATANTTNPTEILNKLLLFGEHNPHTRAVVNRIFNRLGIAEEDITNGDWASKTKDPFFLNALLSGLENFRVDYLFIHRNNDGEIYIYSASQRDDANAQIDTWGQAYINIYKKYNDKVKDVDGVLLKDKAKEFLEDFEAYISGNSIESISDIELAEIAKELREDLMKYTGIILSSQYIAYMILQNIEIKTQKQATLLEAYTNVESLTSTNIQYMKTAIDNDISIFSTGDLGSGRILKKISMANAEFDETIGASVFKNPNGDLVYAHQKSSFHLKTMLLLNNEDKLNELKKDEFLTRNWLLNNEAFYELARNKGLHITRVSGFKQGRISQTEDGIEESGGVGKTYGDLTSREFLNVIINSYTGLFNKYTGKLANTVIVENENNEKEEVALAPVLIRVLEASNTGDLTYLPVIKTVEYNKEGIPILTEKALQGFINNIISEFERIKKNVNPNTRDQRDIENYNKGKKRAQVFGKNRYILTPVKEKKNVITKESNLKTSEKQLINLIRGDQRILIYDNKTASKVLKYTTAKEERDVIISSADKKSKTKPLETKIVGLGRVAIVKPSTFLYYVNLFGNSVVTEENKEKLTGSTVYEIKFGNITRYTHSKAIADFLQGNPMYVYMTKDEYAKQEQDIVTDLQESNINSLFENSKYKPEVINSENINVDDLSALERVKYYKQFGIKKEDGTDITVKDIEENPTLYQKSPYINEALKESEFAIRDLAARLVDRIGGEVKFEFTRNANYSGYNKGNLSVINLAKATLDTPIHEIVGHPIIRAIKNKSYTINEVDKSIGIGRFRVTNKKYEVVRNNKVVKTFNTKNEAQEYINSTNDSLYQNLLKELEKGYGKEVLDKVKKEYKIKIKRELFIEQELGEFAVYNKQDPYGIPKYFKTRKEADDYLNANNFNIEYTLEEQQEEALVQLLGELTAGKIKETKENKNLISFLKQLLKQMTDYMRSLFNSKEIEIDKLRADITLNDLANLLAYTNSKIILPGSRVEYTTPDGQKFNTYQEASNHISKLFSESEDVDLSDVKLDYKKIPAKESNDLKDTYFKARDRWYKANQMPGSELKDYLDLKNNNAKFYGEAYNPDNIALASTSSGNYYILIPDDLSPVKITKEKFDKLMEDYLLTPMISFLKLNKDYEKSKEIVENWKKENNIVYNPEEVYSRGQGFYSAIGAYAKLELDLLLQNLLQHIEDNKKAGGMFAISSFTKPINKRLRHLEGDSSIRFVMYPKSEDILWATPTDAYSGSVWKSSMSVSEKKSELVGVSHTKYPAINKLNYVSPNLADIIDKRIHHHNELGIKLTNTNFRLEYDENVPNNIKKLVDSVNSILDQRYGKIVKPKIGSIKNKIVGYGLYTIGSDFLLKRFDSEERAEAVASRENQRLIKNNEDAEYIVKPITEPVGIEPTQTEENTISIESIISNLPPTNYFIKEELGKFVIYSKNSFRKEYDLEDIFDTKTEAEKALEEYNKKANKKEYTEQALINTKVAKLKEVAKKYPRSLISSKVINNTQSEVQYQQSKLTPKQQLQQKLNELRKAQNSNQTYPVKEISKNQIEEIIKILKSEKAKKLFDDVNKYTYNNILKKLNINENVIDLLSNSLNVKDFYKPSTFKESLFRGQEKKPIINEDGNLVLIPTYDTLFKSEGISFSEDLSLALNYGYRYSKTPYIIEIDEEYVNTIIPYDPEGGSQSYGKRVIGDEKEQRFITKETIIIPKGKYKIHSPNIKINLKNISTDALLNKYREYLEEGNILEYNRYSEEAGEFNSGIASENQDVYYKVLQELKSRGITTKDLILLVGDRTGDYMEDIAEYFNLKHESSNENSIWYDVEKVTPELVKRFEEEAEKARKKISKKDGTDKIIYNTSYSFEEDIRKKLIYFLTNYKNSKSFNQRNEGQIIGQANIQDAEDTQETEIASDPKMLKDWATEIENIIAENNDLSFEEAIEQLGGMEEFKAFLINRLEKEFEKFLNEMSQISADTLLGSYIKEGLKNADGKKTSQVDLSNSLLNLTDDFTYNLKQIFFNDWLNTSALNQILLGDRALILKDSTDEVKRAKGSNAAGDTAATAAIAEEFGIMHETKHISMFGFQDPENTKSYGEGSNVQIADGQTYGTIKAFKHFWFGLGKLTPKQSRLLQRIENGEKIPYEELLESAEGGQSYAKMQAMMNSKKFVYDDGKVYLKTSIFFLTKEYTSLYINGEWVAKPNRVALHNLRVSMEKFEEREWAEGRGTLALAAPASALKKLKMNIQTFEDATSGREYSTDNRMDMDAEYMRLQTINPSNKIEITDPNQVRTIITSEQNPDTEVIINGKTFTIAQIRNVYNEALTNRDRLNYTNKRNLIFRFDLEKANELLDKSKKANSLLPELYSFLMYAAAGLEASNATSNIIEMFSVDENGQQKYNLNNPQTVLKFEQLFLSFFTKGVMASKIPGVSAALVSDMGVRVYRKVYSVDKNGMPDEQEIIREDVFHRMYDADKIIFNIDDGPILGDDKNLSGLAKAIEETKEGFIIIDRLRSNLKEYDENGNYTGQRYSEMILPIHEINMARRIANTNQPMPDFLSKMFTVRIPSQDKHSFMNIKWVDFMPGHYGSSAVVARELIEISGADFDIDKLYMHMKAYFYENGQFYEYGNVNDNKEGYEHYIKSVSKNVKKQGSVYGAAVDKFNKKNPSGLTNNVLKYIDDKNISENVAKAIIQLGLPLTYEDYVSYKNEYNEEPYTEAINNKILDYKFALLGNEHITNTKGRDVAIQHEPADTKPLTDLLDELSKTIPYFENLNSEEDVDIDNLMNKMKAFEANKAGANSIGAAVLPNLYLSLLKEYKISLPVIRDEQSGELLTKNLVFDEILYKDFDGEYAGEDGKGVPYRKQYLISALITAMTDNAKLRLSAKLGLNKDALAVVANMVALGVPLKTSILLINNPLIQQLYFKAINKETPTDPGIKKLTEIELGSLPGLFDKAKGKKEIPLLISVNDELLEYLITNEVNSEKLEEMDPYLISAAYSVLEQFYTALQIKNYTGHLGSVLNHTKGPGKRYTDVLRKEKDAEALGLNLTNSEYKKYFDSRIRKGEVVIDIRPILKNTWQGNLHNIFVEIKDKLLPRVFLTRTEVFMNMYNKFIRNIDLRQVSDEELEKFRLDLLSYITIKAYMQNLELSGSSMIGSLSNSILYPQLEGKKVTDLVSSLRERDPNNFFLKYFVIASEAQDENNNYGINVAMANTFVKLNDSAKIKIQSDLVKLYTNPYTRDSVIELIHYIMVKDGMSYNYGSLLDAVTPFIYERYLEQIDGIETAFLNPTETNMLNTFGTDEESLFQDFIIGYLKSNKLRFKLKNFRAGLVTIKSDINSVREFTLKDVQENPDTLFIYADKNLISKFGIMKNALRIPYKNKDGKLVTDDQLSQFKESFYSFISGKSKKEFKNYKKIVYLDNLIPEYKKIKEKSPKIAQAMSDILKQVKIDLDTNLGSKYIYIRDSISNSKLIIDLYPEKNTEVGSIKGYGSERKGLKLRGEKLIDKNRNINKSLIKSNIRNNNLEFVTYGNKTIGEVFEMEIPYVLKVGDSITESYRHFRLVSYSTSKTANDVNEDFITANYAEYEEFQPEGAFSQWAGGFMFGERISGKEIKAFIESKNGKEYLDPNEPDFNIDDIESMIDSIPQEIIDQKAQTISGKTPEEGDDINFDDIDIDVEAPSDVFIKTLKAKNKIKGFLNDLTPEQIKKLNKTAEDLFQEFNNTSVTIEEFIENLKNCYI